MPAKGWSKAAVEAELPPQYRTVFGVPPEPWPDLPDSYAFGPDWEPAGTTYVMDEASYLHRLAEHGHTLAWLLDHLAGITRLIDGTATWRVPVRYARAQVVAGLPGPEQIIHSLALRPTSEAVVVTGTVLHDLALVLGGYFHNFLLAEVPALVFHSSLSYHQINISYIEQTEGTAKDGSGGNQHTLVPTVQVPIGPFSGGDAAGKLLPYEVAMALTLQTDTRGPSTRGRVFMGGLTSGALAVNGLYGTATAAGVGQAFGEEIIQPLHDDTTWRMNVVSRRNATSREVQGVAVGVVPDSQRRRRNQLAENYQQAWGTPPGAIPPG